MHDCEFKVTDTGISVTKLKVVDSHLCQRIQLCFIPKEAFIEAYEKYIKNGDNA